MEFTYKFPAVRGKQANKEYYIAMVPLKMLTKLFPADEEYIPPEYRAQRRINESRIPEIKQYIIDNRDSYVFSALSASIDGEYKFFPAAESENIGILEISMDAKFLINDGQHRKAAILEAINEDESLEDETISIVLFADRGLERSQQMFTDLNKNAVKTSNSISELYDSRDTLAIITRETVKRVPFLNRHIDKEKDILGKYSANLFTLNSFYNSNKRIVKGNFRQDTEEFLVEYWQCVSSHILPWKELENYEITKVELREQFIVTQSVVIQVFGRLGNFFYEQKRADLRNVLVGLEKINWRRDAQMWSLRVIRANGRMINNETAIILTCNAIKQVLNLPLDSLEQSKENEFLNACKNSNH